MIFHPTPIKNVWVITPEYIQDHRGFFSRLFCQDTFLQQGLPFQLNQSNLSYNISKGTLRGLHFQKSPFEEIKLITCIQGAVYDVVLDLRPTSATFRHWHAITLSQENRHMIYVPPGIAHGFQTLEDHSTLFYQMSTPFMADASTGVRWDDPAFAIQWPLPITVISEKDQGYPHV
jgi:dTDP-4-dehydrorhamnose 3,5-epimerase